MKGLFFQPKPETSWLRESLVLVRTLSFGKILTMWRKGRREPIRQGERAKVWLYGKKDCHLCDLAKEILYRVQEEIPFELQEIDIESSKDLYARFKERIPVVFIDGKHAFTYKINEKKLRRILNSVSAGMNR